MQNEKESDENLRFEVSNLFCLFELGSQYIALANVVLSV